jgi:hypothetical protein
MVEQIAKVRAADSSWVEQHAQSSQQLYTTAFLVLGAARLVIESVPLAFLVPAAYVTVSSLFFIFPLQTPPPLSLSLSLSHIYE